VADKTPKQIIVEQKMLYMLDLQMHGRSRPLEDRLLEALDESGYESREKQS
jgi:hypothetical protein